MMIKTFICDRCLWTADMSKMTKRFKISIDEIEERNEWSKYKLDVCAGCYESLVIFLSPKISFDAEKWHSDRVAKTIEGK